MIYKMRKYPFCGKLCLKTCENFEIWGSRERWSFVLSLPVTKKLNRVGHFVKTSKKQCGTTLKIHFHDVNLIEEFKNLDLKILLTIKIFMFKNSDPMPCMQNNYQHKRKLWQFNFGRIINVKLHTNELSPCLKKYCPNSRHPNIQFSVWWFTWTNNEIKSGSSPGPQSRCRVSRKWWCLNDCETISCEPWLHWPGHIPHMNCELQMFTSCQVIIKLIIYINFIFPTNYDYNYKPGPIAQAPCYARRNFTSDVE